MLNIDEVIFLSYNKKAKFKIKAHIGPYLINVRVATKEIDAILSQMKFKLSFSCSYDPQGIISDLTLKKQVLPMHTHTPRHEI